ncbi:MAG TPA: hypothetical protein VFI47_05900 [Acidimicrobiales bacterium]|nr:hypothetical protein [Acidimicrobiales bacterium]
MAGAAIGLALRRRPALAFVAGAASHVVMDVVLHWGDETLDWDGFVEVAKVDGTLGLGACAAALAAAPRGSRSTVAAAIAGACLIDMDKPGRHFLGRSPFPTVVDRFHRRIQNEHPVGGYVEAGSLALLAATVGLLAVRDRRAAAPA